MGPGKAGPAGGSAGRGRTVARGDPVSFAEINARATMGLYESNDAPFDTGGWIGREIARTYKIIELLGEGGMGAVFVAEHLRLRKQVAVKIIRPEIVNDEQIALRFRREALATARLEHPHVANAFDYDTLPEGGAYLVMQLVRGQSLRDLLNLQGRMEWQQACAICSQIADALSAAHGEGIVHRDLKPDNILLETRKNGELFVKVLDFGIARLVPEEAGRQARRGTEQQALTRVGMVVGTPGYMAPEQAMGETVDARADLYSLGVILWECIAGRPLWKASTLGELFAKQFKEEPPRLHQVLGGPVPGPLEDIVCELLQRPPEERKLDAHDVHLALKKLALGLDPNAEVTGAYTSLTSGNDRRTKANKVLMPPTAEHEAWHNRAWQSLRETIEELETRHGRTRVLIGVIALALLLLVLPIALCKYLVSSPGGDPGAAASEQKAASADERAGEDAKDGADQSDSAAAAGGQGADDDASGSTGETGTNSADGKRDAPLAPAVAEALQIVLHDDDRGARKKAAKTLLEHEPGDAVPEYARLVARLTDAKSCDGKKDVIVEIAEHGDPRVLPALERLSSVRRKGCSPRGKGDCWGCLRRTLKKTIDGLPEETDSADGE